MPLTTKTSFIEAKNIFGNGDHLGCTDTGAAIWHLIKNLKKSLQESIKENSISKNVFNLKGFVEVMFLITDNDVNSGDQPMDVLNVYWSLVREAFRLIPFDKDGTQCDSEVLFNKYVPRLIVIATQGGNCTVGDPRDSRILNVSGFDSCVPILIDTFINGGKNKNIQSDEDN
jgi:hypothetical protein